MYILAYTPKRKNSKRHIVNRSNDLAYLERIASGAHNHYRAEIYTGNWQVVKVVKK